MREHKKRLNTILGYSLVSKNNEPLVSRLVSFRVPGGSCSLHSSIWCPLGDGSAIRDYIDVNDLATAHLISLEKLKGIDTPGYYDSLNLGTGRDTSVLELIAVFEQELGINLNYEIKERRAGDVQEIYADTSKAKAVLGWETVTSLKDSLQSAYEWEIKLTELE
jgi:UDP-glucose 4-epimerase